MLLHKTVSMTASVSLFNCWNTIHNFWFLSFANYCNICSPRVHICQVCCSVTLLWWCSEGAAALTGCLNKLQMCQRSSKSLWSNPRIDWTAFTVVGLSCRRKIKKWRVKFTLPGSLHLRKKYLMLLHRTYTGKCFCCLWGRRQVVVVTLQLGLWLDFFLLLLLEGKEEWEIV